MNEIETHKARFASLALVILMVAAGPLLGQNEPVEAPIEEVEEFAPQFELGDQLISTGFGMLTPLFFALGPDGISSTNLTVGGVGTLGWASYLNNTMSIGAELSGSFAFTPNNRALYMVPISARYTYYLRSYPFEFPLHVGLGANISRLGDATKVDPAVVGGGEALWNYDGQWAFGLRAQYWFVPQIYLGSELEDDTRLGNFLSINLIARYHI
jgi:hypothetical protein